MSESKCPEQWKLDVNDRYQNAVGIVISLSSAALASPIVFLKDIVAADRGRSIASAIDGYVYGGWGLLAISIFSGILYSFFSAKWAKQAWGRHADVFGMAVNVKQIEQSLDGTYFLMMSGFLLGTGCMIKFMTTYIIST